MVKIFPTIWMLCYFSFVLIMYHIKCVCIISNCTVPCWIFAQLCKSTQLWIIFCDVHLGIMFHSSAFSLNSLKHITWLYISEQSEFCYASVSVYIVSDMGTMYQFCECVFCIWFDNLTTLPAVQKSWSLLCTCAFSPLHSTDQKVSDEWCQLIYTCFFECGEKLCKALWF